MTGDPGLWTLLAPGLLSGVVTAGLALAGVLFTQARADKRDRERFDREADAWSREQRFLAYSEFLRTFDLVYGADSADIDGDARRKALLRFREASTTAALIGSPNTPMHMSRLLTTVVNGRVDQDSDEYKRRRHELEDVFRQDLGLERVIWITQRDLKRLLDDAEARRANLASRRFYQRWPIELRHRFAKNRSVEDSDFSAVFDRSETEAKIASRRKKKRFQ